MTQRTQETRTQIFPNLNPNPNPNTNPQPNPNPYPNTKPQPNPNPNFTNWEVAKEVYVLLNANQKKMYLKKYYMYPGTLLDLFL